MGYPVVAHEVQLVVAVLLGGMDAELAGGQREHGRKNARAAAASLLKVSAWTGDHGRIPASTVEPQVATLPRVTGR